MEGYSHLLIIILAVLLAVSVKAYDSTCSAEIQDSLMYNVGSYTAQDVGLPGNPPEDELLSDAICCDVQYRDYAEPNGFYKFPDVSLFRKVNSSGITTFYDSVCGIPLFEAPIGRTFDEWVEETREHGWPSFRTKEVVHRETEIQRPIRVL